MTRNGILIATCVVVLGAIILFLKLQKSCTVGEPVICEFLSDATDSYVGTWTLADEPDSMIIHWLVDTPSQEIWHEDMAQEKFHFIEDDSNIYVKNIPEGRWWTQSRDVYQQFQTKLPFEPQVFFAELRNDMSQKETLIYLDKKVACTSGECALYRIKSPLREYELTLGDNRIDQILVIDGGVRARIEFTADRPQIEIPTVGIQEASNINIVLEALGQTSDKKSVPAFVKEFEQTRIQAEQSNSDTEIPQYVTPQVSPTVVQ